MFISIQITKELIQIDTNRMKSGDQKVVSSIPTHDQTPWCLRFQQNIEISLCIIHSESLCDRDYPPDPLDQKLG